MGRCPPGVFCLSDGLGTVLLTLFVILVVALLAAIFYRITSPASPIMISSPPAQQAASTTIINKGGDSRYDRAPQPLRDWMSTPEFPPRGGLTSLPINIPTQGLPESFQSVGIINVGEQVLPLYGRRTAGGRDRWNYYTRTDTYNPVPVPVQFQRRDCMDDVGCNEIMSGEDVKIEALRKEGKTNIYRFDGPKYIPGMI
uniref:Uncharacterized protein n=1 Tax=viral metagenome TaxID=1070528 RepID=A0A6C0DE94_9ZZZZ